MKTPVSKTLDLDRLSNNAISRVNLGFRCEPAVKLKLAQEAQSLGLNLSEYVESLVLMRNDTNHSVVEKVVRVEIPQDEKLKQRVLALENDLAHYENETLKEFFNSSRGQTVTVQDSKGKPFTVKIQTIKDVYTILINSFRKEASHV